MKLRIADLFCGAGGAGMGLHRAGFEVEGWDIKPQPHYPFTFHLGNALDSDLSGFDAVWASPPCQRFTMMLNHGRTSREAHPDLLNETRDKLQALGVPYIIENVAGAPLKSPLMLCGEMFGLKVTRHRFFECSEFILAPPHKSHVGTGRRKQGDGGYYCRVYGHETGKASWGEAMGIDWMRSCEITQAIPPAYSEFLGRQLISQMQRDTGPAPVVSSSASGER